VKFLWENNKKEIFLLNKAARNPNLNLDASKYFSRFYKNKYLNVKGSRKIFIIDTLIEKLEFRLKISSIIILCVFSPFALSIKYLQLDLKSCIFNAFVFV